jgi:hypothetical protein
MAAGKFHSASKHYFISRALNDGTQIRNMPATITLQGATKTPQL